MFIKGGRGMKTIKQIFGWIIKIILYPFHLLAVVIERCKSFAYFLLPGAMVLLGLICAAGIIYKFSSEGADFVRKDLTVLAIATIISAIGLFILNYFLVTGVSSVLEKLDSAYDHGDAWSKGINYDEFIQLKVKQRYDKAVKKSQKRYEEFAKGYANAFSQDFSENPNSARFKDKVLFADFDDYKQEDHEKADQRRIYEEARRKQQKQLQDYNTQLENAYITLHLNKNCSFEEVENNYKMLQEMFSTNKSDSKFDTSDAQLEIQNAYDFLRKHYKK